MEWRKMKWWPQTVISLEAKPSFQNESIIVYSELLEVGKRSNVRYELKVTVSPTREPEKATSWERDLSKREAGKVMQSLKEMTLTGVPFIPYIACYDGTTWKLCVYREYARCELEWWGALPEGWESLQKLIRVLQNLARSKTEPQWWEIWR